MTMLTSKMQKVSPCSSTATSLQTKTSALPSRSPRFDQCFLTLVAIEDSIYSLENAEEFFALNLKLCLHHSRYKCFDSFTSLACFWPRRFIQIRLMCVDERGCNFLAQCALLFWSLVPLVTKPLMMLCSMEWSLIMI